MVFTTKHRNINFLRTWYFYIFFFYEYAIISPKFVYNCQNMSIFAWGWYFYKWAKFLHKYCYFAENLRNLWLIGKIWTFLRADIFINALFFTQILLFYQKSAKFATNCQNINFFRDYFSMKIFVYLHMLLFYWRSAKFAIFCPKYRRWTFLGDDNFFNEPFFPLVNTLLIRRKAAKFATNYQNINFPSGWNFQMCDFFSINMLLFRD